MFTVIRYWPFSVYSTLRVPGKKIPVNVSIRLLLSLFVRPKMNWLWIYQSKVELPCNALHFIELTLVWSTSLSTSKVNWNTEIELPHTAYCVAFGNYFHWFPLTSNVGFSKVQKFIINRMWQPGFDLLFYVLLIVLFGEESQRGIE